jgi:hypothetical protein
MNVHSQRSLDARYYTDPATLSGRRRVCWRAPGNSPAMPASWKTRRLFGLRHRGESLFCIAARRRNPHLLQRLPAPRPSAGQGEGNTKLRGLPLPRLDLRADRRLALRTQHKSVPGFDRNQICLTEVRIEDFLRLRFRQPRSRTPSPMDDWFPNVREELRPSCRIRPAEAAGMGGDPRKLQLEGLGRELFRVLSLPAQPPDLRHRRDQARDLRHPAAGLLPAPHHRVRQSRPHDLRHRP